jgi:hypothetical protein
MFKKKFLSILLALGAVVLLPTVALAQTEDDMLYEDTSIEWDTDWDYDWDSDYYDTTYDDLEVTGRALSIFAGIWALVSSVMGLAVYIYTSLAYMNIAKKLNHPNPWFAWVPILNIVLHFQLAQMSGWLVLVMLIPLVNLVVYIIALMKICERRGMDKLLGLLALIPIANFILLGILAWKKDESDTQPKAQPEQVTTPTE